MTTKPRNVIYGLLANTYLYIAIATFLNVTLVALGAWLHIELDHPKAFLMIVGLLLVIGFIDIVIKKINDRGKTYAAYEKFINHLLGVAAVTMLGASNATNESLRVNVMLPDKEERNLSIYFAHGFKDSDLDRYINIPINAGCAGQAWMNRCATLADTAPFFEKTRMPVRWGLAQSEIDRIRPTLKCIFSIPIQSGNQCLGVLNFDSDNEMSVMKFDDASVQHIGYSFASMLAIALEDRVV